MAKDDDVEEKTLPPTLIKLQRLRREGSVPHSRELLIAVSTLTAVLYLFFARDTFLAQIQAAFDLTFRLVSHTDDLDLRAALAALAILAFRIVATTYATVLGLTLIAGIVDAGGIPISFKALAPDMSRIDPFSGLKRYVELGTVSELVRTIVKSVLFLVGGAFVIRAFVNDLVWAPLCGTSCIIPLSGYLLASLTAVAAVILLLAAAVDMKVSRVLFRHQNRMTPSEMKRELKETYGDPLVRQARRRSYNVN